MKIIVNAIPLLNIQTGIGRYIKEVYSRIGILYPEVKIHFFNGTGVTDEMPTPPKANSRWSNTVNLAWKLPWWIPFGARIAVQEKQAKKFFKLSKSYDIYHELGFFPFLPGKQVKTVFTIHDLSLITVPEFHPKDRVMFFNLYFKKALAHTNSIITPSRFTKTEIKRVFPNLTMGIDPIHLGYDNKRFYKRSDHQIAALKSKFGLTDNYLLFVGTNDPRKNIQIILKAIERLPASVKLVCCGWSGWETNKNRAAKAKVLFTGYVTDEELAVLYSGARAFIYPSFYEGFGLPVLEAMACGCPIICSNRTSLPEVAGNAGILCDPDNRACFSEAIHSVLNDDTLYLSLGKKSLVQASKFSWNRTAEKIMAHLIR